MRNISAFLRVKKVYLLIILIILLFFAGRAILLRNPGTKLTYTVKKGNLVDTVQISGTYTTASQTPVTSPTNGVISELYVSNGDQVQKGDPLFHVDSTATVDQVKKANADYQSALGSLQTAKNTKQSLDATMWAKQQAYLSAENTQNYKNSHTQNPSTKEDYTDLEKQAIDTAVVQAKKDFDASEQAYKTADVAVTAASAQVAQAQQVYTETQSSTVTAPASGTVVNLQMRPGEAVSAPQPAVTIQNSSAEQASISTTVSQTVLVIANLSNPSIKASISEDYATRVQAGQKASIVFDSLKDRTFTGIVQSVDTVGTTGGGVTTYNARIFSHDITSLIKPGMTALITIETLRKDNVIAVANSAIVMNNGRASVIDAKTGKHISVTLGVRGVAQTEITSGLKTGDTIVANPDE